MRSLHTSDRYLPTPPKTIPLAYVPDLQLQYEHVSRVFYILFNTLQRFE